MYYIFKHSHNVNTSNFLQNNHVDEKPYPKQTYTKRENVPKVISSGNGSSCTSDSMAKTFSNHSPNNYSFLIARKAPTGCGNWRLTTTENPILFKEGVL